MFNVGYFEEITTNLKAQLIEWIYFKRTCDSL
jgi:hypothetical protein